MARYVIHTTGASGTEQDVIVSDATPLPVTGVGGVTSNVALKDGTTAQLATVDGTGDLQVDVNNLPTDYPSAAANTKLDTVNTNLGTVNTSIGTTNTNLGTDGATPPTVPGTGVRGWLRSIYDKLNLLIFAPHGGLQVSIYDTTANRGAAVDQRGNLQVTSSPPLDVTISGNLTNGSGAGSIVSVPAGSIGAGQAACIVDLRGINNNPAKWTSTTTAVFEGTVDGTNWFTLVGYDIGAGSTTVQVAGPGPFDIRFTVADIQSLRVRCNNFTSGDNVAVTIQVSVATDIVIVKNPLPPGANTVGGVTDAGATLTSRMLAKRPLAGNKLALDTADTSFIYLMEATLGVADSATGWQGIRLPLDANGNIVGDIQQNTGATLTFNNRKTDGNWIT